MMTTAASPSGRLRRIWRGPDTDPAWARPALFALLLATGAFYVIGLTSNGWANSFYSAAVQAGSQSWKAFFFGSSDAGNGSGCNAARFRRRTTAPIIGSFDRLLQIHRWHPKGSARPSFHRPDNFSYLILQDMNTLNF